MDPNYANPEALDSLSSAVNRTLIETGRFFRSKGSMQSRVQLKRTIPASREQFSQALDDLSEQIFMAKAFLERDYEVAKANSAAWLQSVEDATMDDAEIKPERDHEAQPEPPAAASAPQLAPGRTVEPIKEEEYTNRKETVMPETKTGSREEEQVKDEGSDSAMEPLSADRKASQIEQSQQIDDATGQKGPALPRAAEPGEINFNTALDDSMGGVNEFDLQLDFGGTDLGKESLPGGLGVVSSVEDEQIRPDQRTVATITPILEEEHGTVAGGEALSTGLQHLQQQQQQPPPRATDWSIHGQQNTSHSDEGMPGQSSFDDLFMENDGTGEGNLLEGDGELMDLNDIDDNWFT